jgi:CBS domain-containing protein
MLTVRDVLKSKTSAIWSISADDTVYKALEIMSEKDIGALMVMDGEKVTGIFTERDYYCIDPEKSVEECMALMIAAHCRHMPVFENKRLAGIVTFGDIVNAVIVGQKVKIQDLETYISGCESSIGDDLF